MCNMTRTKAFKDYIKKFYNIDAEGMTPTDVVQDFLMKQYGHDSTANSLTSAIVEMIDNDLGPGSGGVGSDLPIIFEAKILASQFVDNFVDKTANIIGGSPEYYAEYEYGDVPNLLENKFYTCLIRIEDELDDSYLPFYVGKFNGEEVHFDELPLIASKYNRKLIIRTQYFDDENSRDMTANYIRNSFTDSSSSVEPIIHIIIL